MDCQLLLYKHEHLNYLQHITGHFPEEHKARSDKGNPTIKTQLKKSVAQCISCTYNDRQHKSSAEVGKHFCYSILHKSLTEICILTFLLRHWKSKLFSNSTLHFTQAACTVFFTISHKPVCLVTTSGITIIVSLVQGNVLLLWNEWQTMLISNRETEFKMVYRSQTV